MSCSELANFPEKGSEAGEGMLRAVRNSAISLEPGWVFEGHVS